MSTVRSRLARSASVAALCVALVPAAAACSKDTPQEAMPDNGSNGSTSTTSTATVANSAVATAGTSTGTSGSSTSGTSSAAASTAAGASPMAAGGPAGPDPLAGKFSLADATKGLTGSGDLVASIDTSKGKMTCKMYEDKAPTTVANFVGLARGLRPWHDQKANTWVHKPAYDGTTFHRVIKGFMIQGGDPLGTGTGEPGYVIPDEIWSGAAHDRAGLICMANRGPNTNGQQFFITDDKAPFLDGKYTIFGECKPLDVEHAIATVDVAGPQHSSPTSPVTIKTVTVSRGKY